MTHTDNKLPFNAETWPRDAKAPERFLCAPKHPKPDGATGPWSHTSTVDNGECAEGCCDKYKCLDCGARWRVEVAQ